MELEIKNLSKTYGSVQALRDFNLKLTQGVYGLLGPNGAGKSTFMGILTDNVKRDKGEILFDGQEILKLGREYRKQVGYMPQQQICYTGMTAQHFLEYMAVLKGLSVKNAMVQQQIEDLLKQLNLYSVRYRKLSGFSGGMKRRVILAQALLGNPKVLILDEPTAGLDPKERIVLRNMIAELATNKIVILATHIVSDIECIADKVILLRQGELICCETPANLMEKMQGKVGRMLCSKEEIVRWRGEKNVGNIMQCKTGYALHLVGDELPIEVNRCVDDINLEDVYLYYFGCQ